MSEALPALKEYVRARFDGALGRTLQSHLHHFKEWQEPVWEWHDASLAPVHDEVEATGAVIADPEIGTCLLVQVFREETNAAAQIERALQYRSDLLPTRSHTERPIDRHGDWRVVLHWLIEPGDLKSWIQQISYLRQETAYFEEVPVDAVVNTQNDWPRSLGSHGLPRLLIEVRSVLSKRTLDDSIEWASADRLIEAHIRQAVYGIDSALEAQLAVEMLDELDRLKSMNQSADGVDEAADGPLRLSNIEIESFRNIDKLRIALAPSTGGVNSHVFQGPNGSGKSSIVEALSLATVGISNRYLEYQEDRNITSKASVDDYISSYLCPLGGAQTAKPKLRLNEGEPVGFDRLNEASSDNLRQKLRATFLSQLGRTDFLSRPAADLGREVTQSYSGVVSRLFNYVSQKQSAAEQERKDFNRSWNIQANISRPSTAQARILERIVRARFRRVHQLEKWFDRVPFERVPFFSSMANLESAWSSWVSELDADLLRESGRASFDGENFLRRIGEQYQQLIERSRMGVLEFIEYLPEVPVNIQDQLSDYAHWLLAISKDATLASSSEVQSAKLELESANRSLNELRANRDSLKLLTNHLQETLRFLDRDRSRKHDANCPTCETDLAERGGTVNVIQDTLGRHRETLARLETEEAQLTEAIDTLRQSTSLVSRDSPPISQDELSFLQNLVQHTLQMNGDLDTLILEEQSRTAIEDALDVIQTPQSTLMHELPTISNAAIEEAVAEYQDANSDFERFSEAPDAWKSLQRRLLDAQTTAVMEHLPSTVQSLWREIALNLTSAPWQYPARAELRVKAQRGETEARIMLEGSPSLAAHILNGAEIYNLSLAWFLTRYLTFGRFHHAFFVLDDPAQQMDQPTFRDFCRLLESLIRLHKMHSYPLSVLTFLHQDSRALDAARATNGILHLLRWNKRGTAVIEKSLRMRHDDAVSPFPNKLLAVG